MNSIEFFRKKNLKILLVANDPGGAIFLSKFVKKYKLNVEYSATGPAKKIFRTYKFKKKFYSFKHYDIILTGTSLKSNIEKKAIIKAKNEKIKNYTLIDHWVNYKSRFKYNNKIILPDNIIVFDNLSYLLVKKVFPKKKYNTSIILDKSFLKLFRIKKKSKIKLNRILFCSNNFEALKLKNYDEKLLSNFIKKKNKNKILKNRHIDLKLHPSEKKNKYKSFLKKKLISKIIYRESLDKILTKYQIIVSTNSMSLVIAKINNLITFNNLRNTKLNSKIPREYVDYII